MPPPTPAQVRVMRQATGLSLRAIAVVLRVHSLTVYRWERGVCTPSDWHVGMLARMAFHANASRACHRCRGSGMEPSVSEPPQTFADSGRLPS